MKEKHNEEQEFKEEIRKEFQVERMILFSDAVFAIVITLMAIEIRFPEHNTESITFSKQLLSLLPVFIAYSVSFFFIGQIWYEHLQVFSYVKDYDKGLVVRNLFMLFFIGLFPFSTTIISNRSDSMFLPAGLYFTMIVLCKGAQLVLQHYILVKRPNLRRKADIQPAMIRFRRTRLAVTLLSIMFFLVVFTAYLIKDPDQKSWAWGWFIPFPLVLRFGQKRIQKKHGKVKIS